MDEHSEFILDQYRRDLPVFEKMQQVVVSTLKEKIKAEGIVVDGLESRVKTEESLAGKLELKGMKYHTLSDITDIVGARIITFFGDEVDRIAEMVRNTFVVDWDNSVDKRALLDPDRFGYMSLHYVCTIPKSLFFDENCPKVNEYRFEIQMRTALQHVWATIYHDTGYKSDVEVPTEFIRGLTRLAGVLELADDEFQQIRDNIDDYRNSTSSLIEAGEYSQTPLDGDTYKRYLEQDPFGELAARICEENAAELHKASDWCYLAALKQVGMRTLGDVEKMKTEDADDACKLMKQQLMGKDIDILSSTTAVHSLCTVHVLKDGGGEQGLERFLEAIYGQRKSNATTAKRVVGYAREAGII